MAMQNNWLFLRLVILSATFLGSNATPSWCQSKTDQKTADAAVSTARFGISFFYGLNAEFQASVKPSPEFSDSDPAAVSRDVGLLSEKFRSQMAAAQATASFAHDAGDVAIKTIGLVGAGTGIGVIPTTVIVSALNAGNEHVTASIRKAGEDRARLFLNESLSKWDEQSGVKYEDVRLKLSQGDVAGATKDFEAATGMLTQLRTSFQGDMAGSEITEKFLWDTMIRTERATLAQTAANTKTITSVQTDLANHVKLTRKFTGTMVSTLERFEGDLTSLEHSVNQASRDIRALADDQQATARELGAVQQILFEQQSPATKVYMLESGLAGDLAPTQRDRLLTYYRVEVRKQEIISTSAKVVDTARQIQGIANALGISDPKINQAIEYASVGQTALSQALSGNYIGAIASVANLFGGRKPDPDQERFNRMMGFLDQMDKKLTQVINLQVKTLEAIEALSNQIADLDQRLNNRLDRVEFELKTISQNLRSLLWAPYAVCNTAWQDRSVGGAAEFDDSSMLHRSQSDLKAFMRLSGANALSCARRLDDLYLSLKASSVFGELLSLSAAARTNFDLAPAETNDTALSNQDLLRYLTGLHTPAWQIVQASWAPKWGAIANSLALMSFPSPSATDLKARIATLDEKAKSDKLNGCSEPTLITWRLRSLLCRDDRYAGRETPKVFSGEDEKRAFERARAFLGDPIIRDQLPRLAEWSGLAARVYDHWSGAGDGLLTAADLMAGMGAPRGKDLIWSLLSVLDLAIAQQAMLHGDLNAKFVYDLAWDKKNHRPKKDNPSLSEFERKALALLRNPNNPWLARNVLMLALDVALKPELQKANVDVAYPYARTLKPFFTLENPSNPSAADKTKIAQAAFLLRGVFDYGDQEYEVVDEPTGGSSKNRRVYLRFDDALRIEMPSPEQFSERTFLYPPSLRSLIALRAKFAERFVDYDLLDSLDRDARVRAARTLIYGLAQGRIQ